MNSLSSIFRPVVLLEILTTVATLLVGFSLSCWIVFLMLPPMNPWMSFGALVFLGLLASYWTMSPMAKMFARLGERLGILH